MPTPAWPTLDLVRHARHLSLPQVGPSGQRAISSARVALLGLDQNPGVLSARCYLEAAGVRTITRTPGEEVDVVLAIGTEVPSARGLWVRAHLRDGHPVIERDDPREPPSAKTRRLDVDPAGSEPPTPAAEQAAWTAAGALAACEVLWRLCAGSHPPASSPASP